MSDGKQRVTVSSLLTDYEDPDHLRAALADLDGSFIPSLKVDSMKLLLERAGIAFPNQGLKSLYASKLVRWVTESQSDGSSEISEVSPDSLSDEPVEKTKKKKSTSRSKTLNLDPIQQVLSKLETLGSRLSALEAEGPSHPPAAEGWLDELSEDADLAISQSGFTRDDRPSRRHPARSTYGVYSGPPRSSRRGGRRSVEARFQESAPRRIHTADGADYLTPIFLDDTFKRFSSVRSRVDQSQWQGERLRREAITLAVAVDLLKKKNTRDAFEVMVRRLTALEYADQHGGRAQAWRVARQFESALTVDRIGIDPVALRSAMKRAKMERASHDGPSSSSEDEPSAPSKKGKGRRRRG